MHVLSSYLLSSPLFIVGMTIFLLLLVGVFLILLMGVVIFSPCDTKQHCRKYNNINKYLPSI